VRSNNGKTMLTIEASSNNRSVTDPMLVCCFRTVLNIILIPKNGDLCMADKIINALA